jgi:hypothetical protein
MVDEAVATFADRIRARYTEGLTGIFAIGGTRTTFILEQNRDAADPGRIEDFSSQAKYLEDRYMRFIKMFYDLGGQNMIITASSFRGFHERGAEYANYLPSELLRLCNEAFQAFYRANEIDPYFVGIDIFFNLPPGSPNRQLGEDLKAFQESWPYKEGRRKLVWEIASIPLYSFWKAYREMSADEQTAFETQVSTLTNLEDIHALFYKRFSQVVYGTEIPMPHFYLGTNKSGDLKWRSPMPISLTGGEHMRMFYTPYPTLFITHETMQAILEDLAFKERFHSLKEDYRGRYTSDMAQAEYQRVVELSANPKTTLGFSRRIAEIAQVERA